VEFGIFLQPVLPKWKPESSQDFAKTRAGMESRFCWKKQKQSIFQSFSLLQTGTIIAEACSTELVK